MKKTTLLLLAASLMAAGCGKIGRPGSQGGKAIFPNVSASSLTKGVTVTTGNLGTFKTMAVTGPYIDHTISETVQQPGGVYFTSFVKKDGSGKWKFYDAADATTPAEHYWINGNDIVFWSWYPLDLTTAATGNLSLNTPVVPPTTGYNTLGFSYTLPTHVDGSDATNQKDIVFAGNVEKRTFEDGTDDITSAVSNGTTHTNDEYFSIVFHHALSKVQFGVDLSDNTFNKSLKIKKIALSGLRSAGACTFTAPSTFVWDAPASTDLSNTWSQSFGTSGVDFSSYGSASPSLPTDWPLNSSNNLYICTNAFFLIPQEIGENAAQMTVTFDLGGTEISKTAYIPEFEWKGDRYYTYKIKAQGDSDTLSLGISLADWSERENYIPIY